VQQFPQILRWTAGKSSVLGRLLFMSALGGVLAAAVVVPVVAFTGILVRNTADKFTTLTLPTGSQLPQRSEIFDGDGHLMTYVYGVDLGPGMTYTGLDRTPVFYDQISPNMLNAIVAIEDDRFWTRGALDIKGTFRALVNDLQHKPIQGGSTIEQQYVKGVLVLQGLGNPAAETAAIADNLSRKLNQLRMAVDVAHTMSKQQILAGYLNNSFYGSGAWGIEAAAETYFGTTAKNLTLTQGATLAGIVENPSRYDPLTDPSEALARRNTVLARMMQTKVLSPAAEAAALKQKLGLNPGAKQNGCTASTVGNDAFFCDYVMHAIMLDKAFGATTQDRAKLLATGGLRIYTTVSPGDEAAATAAVNWVLPSHSNYYNPKHNADTQVMIQPGTGQVMAIAEDRQYGIAKGDTEVDYAVGTQYGGQEGVQTGSSSKLFTLITALEQGLPFGFQLTVHSPDTIGGFTNCEGQPAGSANGQQGVFPVVNSEGAGTGTYSLYTGTTGSINVFYGHLEQKVGLCNVVHTAANLGLTWANGVSLLKPDPSLNFAYSADNYPGFTLGELNVTPMGMAAAYATVAANGRYCEPIVLTKIVTDSGGTIPVPSAHCRQAISTTVAEAVNYILQGVIQPGGTAGDLGLPGREAAGKTGTSNVASGNGTPYAAFAGYIPTLASYTSVFNPMNPTTTNTMTGTSACYRDVMYGLQCPGEMFGAMAPGSTWYYAFTHDNLGPDVNFTPVPYDSELWSQGNGLVVIQPKKPSHGGHGGGGGTGGGGTGGPPHP
jgi:membrane peptidoglycan carboxypeptidase